jgi:hypothetical protein
VSFSQPVFHLYHASCNAVDAGTSGLSVCLNGVHWMYRQLGFPYVQVTVGFASGVCGVRCEVGGGRCEV